jgi:hypothetical protein
VIAVFMCDQHRIETLNVFANHCQAARNFFRAQACVNQNASFSSNDQNRISS